MSTAREHEADGSRAWLVRPGRAGCELLVIAALFWLLYGVACLLGGRDALPVLTSVARPDTRVLVLAALTEFAWLCARLLSPALVIASLPFLAVWIVRRVRAKSGSA